VVVVVASSNGDLVVVAMVVAIMIMAVRDDGDGVCWPYDECGVAGIWTVRGKEDAVLVFMQNNMSSRESADASISPPSATEDAPELPRVSSCATPLLTFRHLLLRASVTVALRISRSALRAASDAISARSSSILARAVSGLSFCAEMDSYSEANSVSSLREMYDKSASVRLNRSSSWLMAPSMVSCYLTCRRDCRCCPALDQPTTHVRPTHLPNAARASVSEAGVC
jgi:hypothetical protein